MEQYLVMRAIRKNGKNSKQGLLISASGPLILYFYDLSDTTLAPLGLFYNLFGY